MRVVLDTNVLIAAFIARGVCAQVLEHCVLRHTLVSSEAILAEFVEHVGGKLRFNREETLQAVDLLRSRMQIVNPDQFHQPICRDPDDDVILGTATAGNADCIVTGDKDLLVIQRYQGIEIVNPSGFAEFEASNVE